MANYSIITDLNRCVGCLACTVACKVVNKVPVGDFKVKTMRVGPNPTAGGSGHFPDVEMYFLPMHCQLCMSACPYGVRYLDPDTNTVDKCDLCTSRVEEGLLPHCVTQCAARARFFGDLDEGVGNFEGPAAPKDPKAVGYEDMMKTRVKFKDYVEAYEETDVHNLVDTGNGPHVRYLLRAPRTWREEDFPILSAPQTVEAICDAQKK